MGIHPISNYVKIGNVVSSPDFKRLDREDDPQLQKDLEFEKKRAELLFEKLYKYEK